MAVGLNFTLLSKYIHGCGLILLHRKELGPSNQAGKREEPGGVDQEWVWWWGAQARAHGCCASSRGPGKCQTGKSHSEFGLCTRPLGTQSSCVLCKSGPRLSEHVRLSGAETRRCVEHFPDIPTLLQFSWQPALWSSVLQSLGRKLLIVLLPEGTSCTFTHGCTC